MKIRTVKVKELMEKMNLFVRVALNQDHALNLAVMIDNGVKMDRPTVTPDNVIIDGRHRTWAYDFLKRTEIEVEVIDISDETEIIARAYRANQGGALPPTKEDTEHTVEELVKRGEKAKRIADLLRLPASMIRTYVTAVESRLTHLKLKAAVDSITNGGNSLPKAAEQYGVDAGALRRIITQTSSRHTSGIGKILGQISANYRSIASRNGKICRKLIEKYEDGDVTARQVHEVLKKIDHLQKRGADAIEGWKKRLEVKVSGKK